MKTFWKPEAEDWRGGSVVKSAAALGEDQGLISITHIMANDICNSKVSSSGLLMY